MAVIMNKWVEKEKKKKVHETAPAFASDSLDSWLPINAGTTIKRHTKAARSTMVRTLRGVRKQMQCKSCNYPDSRVVDTTRDEKTNQIYRRRECIKCGVRCTTQEHFRDNYKYLPYKTSPPKQVLEK